ncbi:MAG TPA: dihydrofolate reductase [Rhizomicrobium sp.]|jgi:dihydrofolate reductase|nr:dihydrofolate reductase [Rhizomicrobium sp.]
MIVSLVLAMAENGVIGKDGALPWRIPEDMRHFKSLTMGKPCIMGRKTWDSLPKKPLPGRDNVVVTRDRNFRGADAHIAHSFDEAIAQTGNADEIMVIGGTEIYAAALPHAHRIYLTEIHAAFDGDAIMPPFDEKIWQETAREMHAGEPSFSFVTLERRAQSR